MKMKIETMLPYRIAYLRHIGPYGTGNVQTMERLKSWAKSRKLLDESAVIFGIALDNPETTAPKDCRYDVCIVVSEDYSVNDDHVCQGNIAGGRYAVFTISHTEEAVQKAWLDIFPELSKQDYQFDEARPIIERYIVKMVNNHLCEICVPIK
jgi:DNA gyrase inhibitor